MACWQIQTEMGFDYDLIWANSVPRALDIWAQRRGFANWKEMNERQGFRGDDYKVIGFRIILGTARKDEKGD